MEDKRVVEQGETYDEYEARRWAELEDAWREGRLKRGLTTDKMVKMIRDEYKRKLH